MLGYAETDPIEKRTTLIIRCGLCELVEDMEITFVLNLTNHTTLFQKIVGDLSPYRLALGVKHNLEILPLKRCQ